VALRFCLATTTLGCTSPRRSRSSFLVGPEGPMLEDWPGSCLWTLLRSSHSLTLPVNLWTCLARAGAVFPLLSPVAQQPVAPHCAHARIQQIPSPPSSPKRAEPPTFKSVTTGCAQWPASFQTSAFTSLQKDDLPCPQLQRPTCSAPTLGCPWALWATRSGDQSCSV